MFRLLGQRHEVEEKKQKQLWGREFNVVKKGLDEEQVIDFVNELVRQQEASYPASVRSIIKTAIKGAEQIVDSVKMRARAEAQEEAARIITQARRGVQAAKGGAKTEVEKEAEDIPSVADKAAEERIEEAIKEETEETAQPQEEVVTPESVAALAEEPSEQGTAKEELDREEIAPVLPKQDRQSLYTGEVELVIGVPVAPNMVAALYDYLQTTSEIKFVRTSGSWNRGTTITVVLDKPIPLIGVLLSKLPEAEITPAQPGVDGFVKGRKGVRSINITMKGK